MELLDRRQGNFRSDREAGDQVLAAMPGLPLVARMLRRFLITLVDELTAAGVRQFLDIGTGLPTADNTHDVAQRAAPGSRIVYVDHDPVVISHAQALPPAARPENGLYPGRPAGLGDDLAGAQQTLDFSRPVAVLLIAVLHFILDAEDPHRMISAMMADLAPGSYLVIAHAASDIEAGTAAAMARSYNATSSLTITPRDQATVARFFDGLEMTGPGLMPLAQWWGSSPAATAARPELLLRYRQKAVADTSRRGQVGRDDDIPLLDLAGRALGQRVDDPHVARVLVRRDLALERSPVAPRC